MWPNNPFATPVSSFQRPVPLVLIDPDVEPNLCVKFNKAWLPYIIGALQQLLLQTTWRTTDADLLNQAQSQAFTLINLFANAPVCSTLDNPTTEFDMGEFMGSLCEALRWHDGKLQAFCCGEWGDVEGGGPSTNVQPTDGGTLEPGQSKCYDAVLQANGKWLLPVQVSEGDIITVSAPVGGWTDGTVNWYCPNGGFYTLGACGAGSAPVGGDPVPSISHMRLIAQVDTAFYDAIDNAIAVPSGATNVNVQFQANDATLTDNAGSIQFSVCVTRAPEDTTITMSYALGSGPATAQPGDTIILSSACCGGGGGSDWGVNVTFSRPVLMHVVGQTGFTVSCATSCVYAVGQNPVGTQVTSLTWPASSDPRDFDDTVLISLFDLECGLCGAPWSVTVVIA